MNSRKHWRRRSGLSEVMGVLLTVAITLIAGAAVWSYVNGEAAVSENRYGQAVAGSIDFLNERFVVVDMSFVVPSCTSCVSFYIYNNGQIGLQLKQVLLYDSTQTLMSYDCNLGSSCTSKLSTGSCASSATISPPIGSSTTIPIQGNPQKFTISLSSGCSFISGSTYYLNILGANGNDVIYYQVK